MNAANLLRALQRWAAESESPEVDVVFTASDPGLPKSSATVRLQGAHRAGQLTVWETGEVELEAYGVADSEPLSLRSVTIKTDSELRDLLAELMSLVQFGPD